MTTPNLPNKDAIAEARELEQIHMLLMERRLRQLCNSFPQISGVPDGNKATFDEVLAGYAKLRAQIHTGPMVIEAEKIIRKEQAVRAEKLLVLIQQVSDQRVREAQQAGQAKFEQIDKMISEFIRSLPSYGSPDRVGPPDYDPLVRQIRDFARDNYGGGLILSRAIKKTDDLLDYLSHKQFTGSKKQ